ncbi:MAG: glycoside hydrolase family 3 N-terminal domain-containing protein [Rhodothermales bacterium]|nr:glycoside hydrolase family 3 N-terminal domain-containing protein [Rhodothermales bacterium]
MHRRSRNPHFSDTRIERTRHIARWDGFQLGSLFLVITLIALWVLVAPRTHTPAPARQIAEASVATDPFQLALDSLFSDYDPEVLALLRPDTTGAARWVDSMMASLTLEQKIGQLFIVNLPARTRADAGMEAVTRYAVGGFLVSRTMEPRELFEETRRLQARSAVPLFFAADYERGVGQHDNNLTEWPSNMGLGATRDLVFAAAAGRLTAVESRAVGVNMILAPVVDVNNNPLNPIINIRSYGEDPTLVGEMAAAFVREAQAHGVMTTLKHFPGHGNTSVDTHSRMGTIPGDRRALEAIELFPYRYVLNKHVRPAAVMSAHLWIPALDAEPIPATFSRNALHGLLRDTMQFDGLVITDDVAMGALQNEYTLPERITFPLRAGADMVLTPTGLDASVRAVRDAVRKGDLTESHIDGSVRRILLAKARAGVHTEAGPNRALFEYIMALPRGEPLAQRAADQAVTLLKNDDALPFTRETRVLLVQLTNSDNSPSIGAAMDLLADQLGAHAQVVEHRYGRTLSGSDKRRLDADAASADAIVVSLYLRLVAGRGDPGLFPEQQELVQGLIARPNYSAVVTLGNPYAITPFTDADALVIAYEQTLASVRSIAGIMTGQQAPNGRLPITVGAYAYGAGLELVPVLPLTVRSNQAGD